MVPHPDDTIVALSSAPGPGRRAIVRVGGPNAVAVVQSLFTPALAEPPFLTPGRVRLTGVHSPLPADAYVFRGPRSYTGQDLVELHTVSSPPLVERLVADLLAAGARPAQPGEFTLRAFLSGKKDLTRAEAVLAVIDAGSSDELTQALAQLAGGLARPLDALRDDLLSLLADVEAGLDFVDEDIEFVGKAELLARLAAGRDQLAGVGRQLDDRAVSGRPVRVALVGEPNAGKSSLFNALTGGAALVSPVAGTTRDYLTRRLDLGGVPADLVDTAGWQAAADGIEAQAQRLGREQAAHADLALWCVPADAAVPAARPAGLPAETILVRTKADVGPPAGRPAGAVSVHEPATVAAFKARLADAVAALARPAAAPSQSRCRRHVAAAVEALTRAHGHAANDDPQELFALELRTALDQIGEMVGAVYTNDLLDRIFSRFCIGK